MIGYFPKAYPDELLYSICARCFDRMCYPNKQALVQELFGTRTVLACIELPSHLDDLIAALPAGHRYTADQLIDHHTLLPFYGPFLPPDRLEHIRQDMHAKNGSTIHMRLGIMASRVSLPRWLRLCPCCVQEDRKNFDECYWHRIHQIPGVEVCPFHKVYLQDSMVLAHNSKTRYEFVSGENALKQGSLHTPVPLASHQEFLLQIALDADWLLGQYRLSQDSESLYHRYRKLLINLDLATYNGRVFARELIQKFRFHYSPEMLDLLHCEIEENINESWLLRLVRKPEGAQHPLHHLLLIRFLGHSVETFFELPTGNCHFGEGPWPCLNPTCTHYQQYQIKACQITYSQHVHGKPVGMFSCTCGFVYSRTGPDRSAEDLFKLSKVKAFGHVWEERLKQIWEDEIFSLREIARQLGVDPLTVKRHAMRLGLLFPRPVGICLPLKEAQQLHVHGPPISEPGYKDFYRVAWLAIIQEDPHAGVQAFRKKIPQVYTWLYRNDRVWLKEHTPSHSQQETRCSYSPINWKNRDAQIAGEVHNSVTRLREAIGRPTRITVSSIGRDIGQLAIIQQHLDKLPLTAKSLVELVETREMFAIRRILWAINQFKCEELSPTRWQLIKRAGVERLTTHLVVRESIDAALQALI